MEEHITINSKKIDYLLRLFKFTPKTFIEENNILKITQNEIELIISNKEYSISHSKLKEIDAVFEMGEEYYRDFLTEKLISKEQLEKELQDNVFFRKNFFNSKLNLESKKKIIHFNQLKRQILTLASTINYNLDRKFEQQYTVNNNSKKVAQYFKKKNY